MSLNESIVEDAALTWFGELGVGRVKSEMGRVKFLHPFPTSLFTLHSLLRELVLVRRLREAIRRLNPAIPEEAREGTVAESATVRTKEPKS